MKTVIDELVVELGLEPSKFTEGQKQALDSLKRTQEEALKVSKEIESHGKKINEFFSGLKREAIGLLAAFFGGRGVKEFGSYITTANASIGRTANVLQMSAKELAVWQGMARATGGSAESVTTSMKGLSNAVNMFLLTGQGPFLPVMNAMQIGLYKANHELKTAGELMEDFHLAAQRMGPGRAKAMLTALGMDESTVNLLIASNEQFKSLRKNVEALNPPTKEDAEAAVALAAAWSQAETAAENLGTKIMTKLTPALVGFFNRWRDIFAELSRGQILSPDGLLSRFMNYTKGVGTMGAKPPSPAAPGPSSSTPSPAEVREYVRQGAIARGLPVDKVLAKFQGESGFNVSAFNPEGSYGFAQLYYGGGLGNIFTKQTGLKASDPSTWKQQADFSLDWMKGHGSADWKAAPWANFGPGSGGGTSIKVNQVIVNTKATDADGIARDIKPALERDNFASQANFGQN